MGTDITTLKLLAAVLSNARLNKEADGHWRLSWENTYTKGSKLDKVANDALDNQLLYPVIGDRYIPTDKCYEKLRRMEIE